MERRRRAWYVPKRRKPFAHSRTFIGGTNFSSISGIKTSTLALRHSGTVWSVLKSVIHGFKKSVSRYYLPAYFPALLLISVHSLWAKAIRNQPKGRIPQSRGNLSVASFPASEFSKLLTWLETRHGRCICGMKFKSVEKQIRTLADSRVTNANGNATLMV